MCSPELDKKSEKNINGKKSFEHDISPLCRGGPVGPIFTIFYVWGQTADVIIHVKFQIDRSKGLGSTGTQSRVFPIDFDRLPYFIRYVSENTQFCTAVFLHLPIQLVRMRIHKNSAFWNRVLGLCSVCVFHGASIN